MFNYSIEVFNSSLNFSTRVASITRNCNFLISDAASVAMLNDEDDDALELHDVRNFLREEENNAENQHQMSYVEKKINEGAMDYVAGYLTNKACNLQST